MQKSCISSIGVTMSLVLVFILLFGGLAMAVTPADLVTRGQFSAMLAEKAGIPDGDAGSLSGVPADASYAGALAGLVEAGIIAGYPDGSLGHERPVTGAEAVVLVGRVLGLPSNLDVEGINLPGLSPDHWAYDQVAWMSKYGLALPDGNLVDSLTSQNATAFIEQVFSADDRALELALKSTEATKKVKTFSMRGSMQMTMVPKPGISDEEVAAFDAMAGIDTDIQMDFVMPDKMRQVITMEIPDLGEMTIEQYLIDSKIYQKLVNPETGEVMWQYMTLPIDMKELLELQAPGIQEAMMRQFNYQYMGTTVLDGKEVHKIGYYGKINSMADLGQLISQPGGSDAVIGELIAATEDLIQSMSMWGVYYIGTDDFLSYGESLVALLGYGDNIPIATAEMAMNTGSYNYDSEIDINLPEEAKDAVEMVIPKSE